MTKLARLAAAVLLFALFLSSGLARADLTGQEVASRSRVDEARMENLKTQLAPGGSCAHGTPDERWHCFLPLFERELARPELGELGILRLYQAATEKGAQVYRDTPGHPRPIGWVSTVVDTSLKASKLAFERYEKLKGEHASETRNHQLATLEKGLRAMLREARTLLLGVETADHGQLKPPFAEAEAALNANEERIEKLNPSALKAYER